MRIYDITKFKFRTYIAQLNALFKMGQELEDKVNGEGMDFKTINNESLKGEGNIELQTPLESGVNIKTINGQSITGAGDLVVGEGGTIAIDGELSTSSENPVQNKVITSALNGKQDTIPSGTYTTPTELNTALADKQDVLTAGTGITIENNIISSAGGSGDSGWEDILLSHLPTDFQDGDELEIAFKVELLREKVSGVGKSWTTNLEELYTSWGLYSSQEKKYIVRTKISSVASSYPILICLIENGSIVLIEASVFGANSLNTNQSSVIGVAGIEFNGVSRKFAGINITRANITNYIEYIRRRRAPVVPTNYVNVTVSYTGRPLYAIELLVDNEQYTYIRNYDGTLDVTETFVSGKTLTIRKYTDATTYTVAYEQVVTQDVEIELT